MSKVLSAVLIFIFFIQQAQAQDFNPDTATSFIEIPLIVISATRTEQQAAKLPVTVNVINADEIKAKGYTRITDVFAELNGTAVVDKFGSGLQLRGLDPAHTLILIDNEPVTGRNGGTFDLNKISVDNIERIEVVKGAASALYGSEALAGVVNIITKKAGQGIQSSVTLGYGSNNTTNLSADFNYGKNKFSSQTFVNGFYTSGFDLDKATMYNSASKNSNGTLQQKINYKATNKLSLSLNSRAYTEEVNNKDNFMVDNVSRSFDLTDRTNEFSLSPGAKFVFNDKTNLSVNHHFVFYDYRSQLNYAGDGGLYYDDRFKHLFNKSEFILNRNFGKNFLLTAGGGYTGENIITTRYANDKFQSNTFGFAQLQSTAIKKVVLIAGARADYSKIYKTNYSPKVSAQYAPSDKIKFSGSYGTGFKSPDFRQLYLNFSNALIGYSVFGSQEIESQLQLLNASGQLQSIFYADAAPGVLKPESSQSMDAGITVNPLKNLTFSVNVYRNDIQDLIETKAVAQKTNGQYVYSYVNLNKVYTQGIETNVQYKLNRNFLIGAGYQYLEAKDKQVIDDIKAGKIYGRDIQTLYSYKLKLDDYGGLFNRSKHSGNFSVQYNNLRYRFGAAARLIYKGKYGLADKNGNLILDSPHEYVDGYNMVNLSVSKEFSSYATLQFSAQNILNYTDAQNIPALSGATYLATLRLKLIDKKESSIH